MEQQLPLFSLFYFIKFFLLIRFIHSYVPRSTSQSQGGWLRGVWRQGGGARRGRGWVSNTLLWIPSADKRERGVLFWAQTLHFGRSPPSWDYPPPIPTSDLILCGDRKAMVSHNSATSPCHHSLLMTLAGRLPELREKNSPKQSSSHWEIYEHDEHTVRISICLFYQRKSWLLHFFPASPEALSSASPHPFPLLPVTICFKLANQEQCAPWPDQWEGDRYTTFVREKEGGYFLLCMRLLSTHALLQK